MTRFAIVGGRVLPVSGPPIESGTVLVADGRIEAVGDASLSVPDDVVTVSARGQWVLPGLIDAHTHLGIQEDGNGVSGADHDETSDPNGAHLRVIDGLNPADPAFRDAVMGGVLAVGVSAGSGNPIGGQAVAVRCVGAPVTELVLRDPCGVSAASGSDPKRTHALAGRFPSTRMGTVAVIREALARARAGDDASGVLTRVLTGEIPLRHHAHRADDIATAVRLSDEFGHRLVITRATEAAPVSALLAERGIPVVLGPLIVARRGSEMRGRSMGTARRLAEAGVPLALSTAHNSNPVQFLAHQATSAVREGLDRATALQALTTVPARILGIDDRLGSLEAGKDADLCLWTGDPFDVGHRVAAAYMRGELVYRYDPDRKVGLFGDEACTL